MKNYSQFLTLGTDQQLTSKAKELRFKINTYTANANEKRAYTWIINELKNNRSINI